MDEQRGAPPPPPAATPLAALHRLATSRGRSAVASAHCVDCWGRTLSRSWPRRGCRSQRLFPPQGPTPTATTRWTMTPRPPPPPRDPALHSLALAEALAHDSGAEHLLPPELDLTAAADARGWCRTCLRPLLPPSSADAPPGAPLPHDGRCGPCADRIRDDQRCPVCLDAWQLTDKEMALCDGCAGWVHARCDPRAEALVRDPDAAAGTTFRCRRCRAGREVAWRRGALRQLYLDAGLGHLWSDPDVGEWTPDLAALDKKPRGGGGGGVSGVGGDRRPARVLTGPDGAPAGTAAALAAPAPLRGPHVGAVSSWGVGGPTDPSSAAGAKPANAGAGGVSPSAHRCGADGVVGAPPTRFEAFVSAWVASASRGEIHGYPARGPVNAVVRGATAAWAAMDPTDRARLGDHAVRRSILGTGDSNDDEALRLRLAPPPQAEPAAGLRGPSARLSVKRERDATAAADGGAARTAAPASVAATAAADAEAGGWASTSGRPKRARAAAAAVSYGGGYAELADWGGGGGPAGGGGGETRTVTVRSRPSPARRAPALRPISSPTALPIASPSSARESRPFSCPVTSASCAPAPGVPVVGVTSWPWHGPRPAGRPMSGWTPQRNGQRPFGSVDRARRASWEEGPG